MSKSFTALAACAYNKRIEPILLAYNSQVVSFGEAMDKIDALHQAYELRHHRALYADVCTYDYER